MSTQPPINCRVCGAPSTALFRKHFTEVGEAIYYRCAECGHLQTEPPYWLGRAYSPMPYARDVGMVSRSIWTGNLTMALANKLGIGPTALCLDYGAGTGLLVRHCRDHGLNMFYQDRYAQNIFAQGFDVSQLGRDLHPVLVTAFEVAEHFAQPLEEFQRIFDYHPEFVFFSTRLYQDQGSDWWYFLDNGQHVAVYTVESLRRVAAHFGYHFQSDFDIHLFSLKPAPWRILKRIRRHPEAAAKYYAHRHGSKTTPDADILQAQPEAQKVTHAGVF